MTFSIYIPDRKHRKQEDPAVMFYLSGLTCTDENARTKAAIYEHANKYNLAVVFPDTSPRGLNLGEIDNDYDIGHGAGFYINATHGQWKNNFKMYAASSADAASVSKR